MIEKCTGVIMQQNAYPDEIYNEIIKRCGFEKQNKILMDAGYNNPKTNYKLLKIYGGDLKMIFNKLDLKDKDKCCLSNCMQEEYKIECKRDNSNNNKFACKQEMHAMQSKNIKIVVKKACDNKLKEQVTDNDKYLLELIENGWSKQNLSLVQEGFTCHKKNLQILKEFNGDYGKSLKRLQDMQKIIEDDIKRQKVEKKIKDTAKMKMLGELNELGYMEGYRQLVQAGYTKVPRNYQFLKAFNGDITRILKSLECDKKIKQIEDKCGIKLCNYRYENIPECINTLVIDGNSLQCIEDSLKKLLVNKKKCDSDKVVYNLCKRFASVTNQGYHCIILFDTTNLVCEEINVSSKGKMLSLIVKSVKSDFQNVIEWVDDWVIRNYSSLKRTMFITLNKELVVDLLEKHISCKQLMSTVNFLSLASKILGQEEYNQILNRACCM